jgi:hypothetical protein
MGGTLRTHGIEEHGYQHLYERSMVGNHLEDPGEDPKIILKRLVKKQIERQSRLDLFYRR